MCVARHGRYVSTNTTPSATRPAGALRPVVGAPLRSQTYRNLRYLALAQVPARYTAVLLRADEEGV